MIISFQVWNVSILSSYNHIFIFKFPFLYRISVKVLRLIRILPNLIRDRIRILDIKKHRILRIGILLSMIWTYHIFNDIFCDYLQGKAEDGGEEVGEDKEEDDDVSQEIRVTKLPLNPNPSGSFYHDSFSLSVYLWMFFFSLCLFLSWPSYLSVCLSFSLCLSVSISISFCLSARLKQNLRQIMTVCANGFRLDGPN